ncbi:UDP-N-acetylglucosamine 1-carboxyvinyltransferase 1 [compost metagenome]
MHVEQFQLMNAEIKVEGRSAIVTGGAKLSGAKVCATDLRAGAALIIAGLVAEGTTEVSGTHHIDRGYVHLTEKLAGLGADIYRISMNEDAKSASAESASNKKVFQKLNIQPTLA